MMISEKYDRQRNAILGVAQDLFMSSGYERVSVQDILNACGIAKGTFYHYFKTKVELLSAVVERWTEDVLNQLKPIALDSSLGAVDKLNLIFQKGGVIKTEMANVWVLKATLMLLYSDEHLLLRHKFTNHMMKMFRGFFGNVIRQGVNEGIFTVASEDCEAVAELLFRMGDSLMSPVKDLMMAEDYSGALAAMESMIRLWETSAERVLGAPAGSMMFMKQDVKDRFRSSFTQNIAGFHPAENRSEA